MCRAVPVAADGSGKGAETPIGRGTFLAQMSALDRRAAAATKACDLRRRAALEICGSTTASDVRLPEKTTFGKAGSRL